jgi:hypothetical protein
MITKIIELFDKFLKIRGAAKANKEERERTKLLFEKYSRWSKEEKLKEDEK